MPDIGQHAPPFDLPSTSGRTVSLADFAGRNVVLFFYPRDSTPGCTREACDFRDAHAALLATNAVVLGVSADSLKSHDKFRAAQKLPFELLSDEGSRVATAYGAYGVKMMYGKKVTGTIRSTFLIGSNGKIAAVWSPVKVDGHAQAVLALLQGRSPSSDAAVPAKANVAAKPAAKRAIRSVAKPASAAKKSKTRKRG